MVELPDDGVVVASGSVLLGRWLPFDVTLVRAPVARGARPRSWTTSCGPSRRWSAYAAERGPDDAADLVVRATIPVTPRSSVRSDPGPQPRTV